MKPEQYGSLPAPDAYELVWATGNALLESNSSKQMELRQYVDDCVGNLFDHVYERGTQNAQFAANCGTNRVEPVKIIGAIFHEQAVAERAYQEAPTDLEARYTITATNVVRGALSKAYIEKYGPKR
jgi:hypothetical protein